jgi:excisionase family DNA binding protein
MVDDASRVLEAHLTVAQAARRLGVSASMVRQLIATGELPAERFGGRTWMVSGDAVERRADQAPQGGRRLSTANAWAILYMLAGEPVEWIDQPTRWRLRRYLASHLPSADRARFANRGRPSAYRAHPSLLAAVRSDPDLMLTGTTAASERRLGLVGGTGEVDAYVSGARLEDLVRRHHLRPSGDPNAILRVVPPFTLAWPPGRLAPASAIALDLLDSPEPRAKQVGEDVLRGIERAYAAHRAG